MLERLINNDTIMIKRRRFGTGEIVSILHNIPHDASEFKDSESEFDDLYTPEVNSASSFSKKAEQEFLGSFISGPRSPHRPSKKSRTQNRLATTEVPQERDDTDDEIIVNHYEKENNQQIELAPDTSQSKLSDEMLTTLLRIPVKYRQLQIERTSLLEDFYSRSFREKLLSLESMQKEMCLLVALQVHDVFLLLALFSNTLQ